MGGELSTFNVQHGYAEGLLRGDKQALLTPDDYRKLSMAETLEDLRSCLEDTEYGCFLQDEPLPLSIRTIGNKCRERFAEDFRRLKANSTYPLTKFLEYIVAERMIDNVVSLIQGALNGKSPEELLARADPLAWTPEMKAILSMDANSGFEEMYRTVLVETPVGRYFEDFLEQKEADVTLHGGPRNVEVSEIFHDLDFEIMRACLKKSWLEDFHAFCQDLGGTTAEVMCDIMKKQADFLTIAVTLNSLNSPSGGGATQLTDRNVLYPSFGYLYPAGTDAMRKAYNDQTIQAALDAHPEYLEVYELCRNYYIPVDKSFNAQEPQDDPRARLKPAGDSSQQTSLEDAMYRYEIRYYEKAFEQQMHFGVFYAWAKLKEQETRNIVWIAEMTVMKRKDNMHMVLPIFAPRI